LEALAAQSLRMIASFNPQDLGNTVWAFASLGKLEVPLMEAIASGSMRKMSDF